MQHFKHAANFCRQFGLVGGRKHLRLTFAATNLDQSEEVRRARIAQLREEVNELKLRRAARNAKFECAKDIAQLKQEGWSPTPDPDNLVVPDPRHGRPRPTLAVCCRPASFVGQQSDQMG
uniref:Transposase n=1 Tax=Globodera pallida TaxID=36090 RepID=A0A183CL50_GLOPA